MIKNNKGFSLIELFAMILITTILIYPLITSLVKNIEINDILQQRRSATSISAGTLSSVNKMSYLDLNTLLETAKTNGDYYYDLNLGNCGSLSAVDESLCISLFTTIWNSLELESTEYKVIIYNFYLDDSSYNDLMADINIPSAAQTLIAETFPDAASHPVTLTAEQILTNQSLLRAIVWIEYYDEPQQTLTLGGLIFDD